jgi:hypothetical protein
MAETADRTRAEALYLSKCMRRANALGRPLTLPERIAAAASAKDEADTEE